MTARDDLDRRLDAFLLDGTAQLPTESYEAARDRIDQTRQRVVLGPWRVPDMNRFVPIAIGAAAVLGVVFLGSQVLGSPDNGGPAAAPIETPAPSPTPSPTPAPSLAATSAPADAGLPEGPFLVSNDAVGVTVEVSTPDWFPLSEFDAVTKDDDGLDPPDSVGGALLAWSWPAGTRFHVYGDPCQWQTTIPETPATTPDEIAAAFAAQAATEATAPVDVTVGGYAGKAITVRVPMSYEVPGATREEKFGECDQDTFVYYGIEKGDGTDPQRNAQGAGQVDELWILDVDGAIVILNVASSPATPVELVDEMRALAASATFE